MLHKLGKILMILFPDFMNRLIMLDQLKEKARHIRAKHQLMQGMYLNRKSISYKTLTTYYTIVYKFKDHKLWFMSNIQSLGRNNKVW